VLWGPIHVTLTLDLERKSPRTWKPMVIFWCNITQWFYKSTKSGHKVYMKYSWAQRIQNNSNARKTKQYSITMHTIRWFEASQHKELDKLQSSTRETWHFDYIDKWNVCKSEQVCTELLVHTPLHIDTASFDMDFG